MEDNLNVKQLRNLVKKNGWILLACVSISTLLMLMYLSFFSTPIYRSSTEVLINQSVSENSQVKSQDVQANLQLVNTYASILKSPGLLNGVAQKINHKYSVKELSEMVDVSSTSDSQVITISVEGENAKDIVKIANDVVQTFRNEIPKIMKVDNVYILSKATFSDNMSPVKPSKGLLIMVSVVLGTVVGIIIMFFRHLFDNSIKTAEDVELLLNLPVLTIISEIKEESLITQNQRSNNRRKRG